VVTPITHLAARRVATDLFTEVDLEPKEVKFVEGEGAGAAGDEIGRSCVVAIGQHTLIAAPAAFHGDKAFVVVVVPTEHDVHMVFVEHGDKGTVLAFLVGRVIDFPKSQHLLVGAVDRMVEEDELPAFRILGEDLVQPIGLHLKGVVGVILCGQRHKDGVPVDHIIEIFGEGLLVARQLMNEVVERALPLHLVVVVVPNGRQDGHFGLERIGLLQIVFPLVDLIAVFDQIAGVQNQGGPMGHGLAQNAVPFDVRAGAVLAAVVAQHGELEGRAGIQRGSLKAGTGAGPTAAGDLKEDLAVRGQIHQLGFVNEVEGRGCLDHRGLDRLAEGGRATKRHGPRTIDVVVPGNAQGAGRVPTAPADTHVLGGRPRERRDG